MGKYSFLLIALVLTAAGCGSGSGSAPEPTKAEQNLPAQGDPNIIMPPQDQK